MLKSQVNVLKAFFLEVMLLKVTLTVAYSLILFYIYKSVVSENYGYMGYYYYTPSYLHLTINIVILAFVSSLISHDIDKPSDLFVWFFFVIVIIPSMVIPLMSLSEVGPFTLFAAQFTFIIGFVILILISNIQINIIDLPSVSANFFLIILLLLFFVISASIFRDYGFNPSRLLSLESLASLYDIRFEQRAASANASIISRYGTSLLTKIIIPMMFVICLFYKRYFWALFFFGMQLSVFSVSAHKSYIIVMLVTFFVFRMLSKKKNAGLYFFEMVSLFCLFTLLIYWGTGNTILIDVLVRRALVVPGLLSGYFIEYFSINGLAFYSQNFLKIIFENQYTMAPPFIIGQEYFGRAELRANVNAFGDTFGNLGGIGVIFNSILMGLILLCLNIFSRGKQKLIVIPSLCGIAWTFGESSFVTSLLTHGALFAVFLVMLFPKKLKFRKAKAS